MTRKLLVLLVVCLLLFACKNAADKTGSDTTAAPVENTATMAVGDDTRSSIDWTGTYRGTTPCADCDGIETSLHLNRDNTYQLMTRYLGTRDTTLHVTNGSFTWDAAGSVITLQGVKDSPAQYKVGEDMVIQYDMQGKEITGALADKYVLNK